MPTGTNTENFPQYSNGLADASYAFDFVGRVALTPGATAMITFNASQSSVLRVRNIVLTDVSPALAGTAPGNGIACYFRVDGKTPTAGAAPDGSYARVLSSGAKVTLSRQVAAEYGVTLYNPSGTATITVLAELAA